jgi:hypothetical protein
VIYPPINDEGCLGQLSVWARELCRTTLVETVAHRLGSRESVLAWIRSKPQLPDRGVELFRILSCPDVPQRLRLFADDPNCVERANDALLLLEVIDPTTPRAFVTIEKPQRHTALVEKRTGKWEPLDLFSRVLPGARRDADARGTAEDVLKGTHEYVGKPLLGLFLGQTGTHLADALASEEQRLYRKRPPPARPRFTPPPNDDRSSNEPRQKEEAAPQAAASREHARPDEETSTEGDEDGIEINGSAPRRDAARASWRW